METRDPPAIWAVVAWLPALVFTAAVISRIALQIRWRQFVTTRIAGRWVSRQRYYHLQFSAPDLPAPEYRIAEDGRLTIIIMDEATSALDEASQSSLLALFSDELRAATLVSVGHRPSLDAFHDRRLPMLKSTDGAVIVSTTLNAELGVTELEVP